MAQDVIQEIKTRIDLVELISQYVSLRRTGRTFKGLCPFHQERTPSFNVDPERGFYKCYGCGEGGDCFKFLQKHLGIGFQEAGEMLARRLGLTWQRSGEQAEARSERERLHDVMTLAQRFFRESLASSSFARSYLEQRGVSPETSAEFGLGYAPPGYEALLKWLARQRISVEEAEKGDLVLTSDRGWRDRFVDRIIFPICDIEGRTIAFGGRAIRADGGPKYLNSRETPIFQKGRTLYGLHLARKAIGTAGHVIAVEGYMDVIALHQAGIANAVATLGTALTPAHVGIIRRYQGEDGESRLVMCYDGDSAGMRAAERNSTMFEEAGCQVRVVELPDGDDPDTFVKGKGPDAFRSLVEHARPLIQYQLDRLRAVHALATDEDRLTYVREAAKIIAKSSSHLTREEYTARLESTLTQLANEWHPGQPHRAMTARASLLREVDRLLRSGEARATPTTREFGRGESTEGPRARPRVPAGAPGAGDEASARSRAERLLIRAALTEVHWLHQVAERLNPCHFQDPGYRRLADALFQDGSSLESRLHDLRLAPEYAEELSGLVIDPSPLTEEAVEQCIGVLRHASSLDRLRELQAAHAAEGGFRRGDPRWDELRSLAELYSPHRRES